MLKLSAFSQDCKIEELQQSLTRFKKVQEMVMSVQEKKGNKALSHPKEMNAVY